MYRDFLTNKWVLGGVGFLIVLSIACVLWYQHDTADDRRDAAEAKQLLRQSEIVKKVANTDSDMEQAADVSSVESNTLTAEKPITEVSDRGTEGTEAEAQPQPAETPTDTADVSENAGVSPFGFGPYPEVPSGYPYDNPWITEGLTEREAKISELLERVRIKLWNEGNPPEGISWEGGKVYPIYPNTVYVDWDYVENEDGTIERYISNATSGTLSDEANALLDEGVIPPGVIVYEHSEVGIDPYNF